MGLDVGSSSFWYMVLCAGVAGVSGLMFGYDSGIITDTIAQTQFLNYFNNPTSSIIGTIVAMLQAGAAVGAGVAAPMNDKWGRKKSMVIGAAFGIVGAALQAGAVSTAMLIVGRVVIGFAIGILTMVVPVYQAEIAPPHERAFLMSVESIMTALGYVIANWVGYGASFSKTSFQWRFPLAVQVLFALLVFSAAPFLPESPRWLIEQGQEDHAFELVKKLHFTGQNSVFIHHEFQEMRDQILAEKEQTVRSYKDVFTKPAWRRRVLLACGVWIGVSLSGITVVNFYLNTFIKNLGFSTHRSLLLTGIYGFAGPISCFVAMIYLDRLPRIKMLWGGNVGLAIILSVLTGLTSHSQKTGNSAAGGAGIAMLFLYSIVYSATYGPISWIYPVEIFPMQIRSIGFSISSVVNYAVMVMFSQVSPIGFSNIGYRYYIFFICSNIFSAVVVFVFYPETKGKSLEQMDELFGDQLVPHALDDPKAAELMHVESHKGEQAEVTISENTTSGR
ncbi:hypothetical protein LTR47_002631 [Exophiala xenobiotica]|nr:hypothetical protein LTR47_002631 [Exophiala xenobiotica]KAK5251300.1 hypothetical protein LTS06_004057 [Exophiala xenobiotica]KAK5350786.1 hypothetical protein LTR61_005984 [Exophiala xenobiotica]KAK5377799.1 hypothetical protein LTS03_004674 [Exophiala xenobiotica]KAK5389216.1 hypothetical protein LTR11_000025 [Exophiala xenobiotica]